MIKPPPPKSAGIAWLVGLFCAAATIAGLGLDVMTDSGGRFALVAQPGARAVLGVGVAVALILATHALRFALSRPVDGEDERRRDADGHS